MSKRSVSDKSKAQKIERAMRKPKAAKPAPDAVPIYLRPGDDLAAAVAQTYLRPTVNAACTVRAYNKSNEALEIGALMTELGKQVQFVSGGDLCRAEATLICQTHVLDAIFGNLARRAAANFGECMSAGETYMRLALKAQSQCRATVETLSVIKNPPSVAFVRQANIAQGDQQVNNGAAPAPSPARENESLQNKLLEAQDGERLDAGTAKAAIGGDTAMETLGAIDRAKVKTR